MWNGKARRWLVYPMISLIVAITFALGIAFVVSQTSDTDKVIATNKQELKKLENKANGVEINILPSSGPDHGPAKK